MNFIFGNEPKHIKYSLTRLKMKENDKNVDPLKCIYIYIKLHILNVNKI